jgi:UMF1 family MFS transporter
MLAWALYDVASSAFVALVPPFFGLYFVGVIASEQPGAQASWGLVASAALTLAGALAPFAGAWADRRGRWLGLLAATSLLCIAATVAMPTTSQGRVLWAATLFITAQVGYTLAIAIYDSLLSRIAPPSHVGRVSGFGWSVGFAGGIVALVVAIALMHGLPADAQVARLSVAFMLAGLLFAAFAVPGLLGLRGLAAPRSTGNGPAPGLRDAYASVISTLRNWRQNREVFRFLIAYYLFNDVLVTIVFFIAIVMRARFGLSVEGLLGLALLYHVIAAPATLAFGHAADRWGPRAVIYVQVAILGAALLLLAFGTGNATPVLVICLLGLVYGSLQAVCRSLFVLLVEREKSGELFGFNAVAGRLSAALGPLAFGAIAAVTGSETASLVSLLAFLIAGAVVLSSLRIPAMRVASLATGSAPTAQ